MSVLSLKIYLADSDTTKTCQYLSNMYVQDVCQDIREKFNYGEAGLDHGLLLREQNQWLSNNKMLEHYDLKYGDTLEFRKRHRVLKVKTLDDSIKAVLVDESQPVRVLVQIVCERIGVSNPDEYSFTKSDESTAAPAAKSNKKAVKEQINAEGRSWLNPDKNLREQGLTEADIVILKKKFFFSDQNVDRTDPVQLLLMYNQAKEAIVSGKHPCTADEAAQFAAIQLQVQYGNHDSSKHKPGFVKLKEFIPPEYLKNKEIEKKVYQEHTKLHGLNDINETATKKRKAGEILLGVTKSSVVRLDVKTKDILTEWDLTKLRRWAATPKNFTLDFGDYEDTYYSVETAEGEQISRLIAGYIDIIIKKRNQRAKTADEQKLVEHPVLEDYVRPGRANNVSMVSVATTSQKVQGDTKKPDVFSGVGTVETKTPVMYSPPKGEIAQSLDDGDFQTAVVQSIIQAMAVAHAAKADLTQAAAMPNLGSDPASLRWAQETFDINAESVSSHVAAHLAALGSLIIHATGNTEEMDYENLALKVMTINTSMSQISQGSRLLAGLQTEEDETERLLAAGRGLAEATSDLLKALQPIIQGNLSMDNFYNSTRKAALCATDLLETIGRLDVQRNQQSDLINAATLVADAVAQVVHHSKYASKFATAEQQKLMTTNAHLATEIAAMLVATTAALAPSIRIPLCREQLVVACGLMQDATRALRGQKDQKFDTKVGQALIAAIGSVEDSLVKLIEKAKNVDNSPENDVEVHVSKVLKAIGELFENIDDSDKILGSVKELSQSLPQLTDLIRRIARSMKNEDDCEELLGSANKLGELTKELVSKLKAYIRDVDSEETKEAFLATVDDLKEIIESVTYPFIQVSLHQRVVQMLKSSIACTNQIIAASRTAGQSNKDPASQTALNRAAKKVVELIPKIITSIKGGQMRPNDPVSNILVIRTANEFVDPCFALFNASKTASGTVSDTSAKMQLLNASIQLGETIAELKALLEVASQITPEEEIEGALESLEAVEAEIEQALTKPYSIVVDAKFHCNVAELELAALTKKIGSNLTSINMALASRNEKLLGSTITETVSNLQTFSTTAIGVAFKDTSHQTELLEASGRVGEAVRKIIFHVQTKEAKEISKVDVAELIKDANYAMAQTVFLLPGQQALSSALKSIKDITANVNVNKIEKAQLLKTIENPQAKLMEAANELTTAAQALVQASNVDPKDVQENANTLNEAFQNLVQVSAVLSQEDEHADMIKSLGLECNDFLNSIQGMALDPDNMNLKGMLLNAAKSVAQSVDGLLDTLN